MSIVNDNIPEDVEMFNATLTLDPADRGNRVRVSPEITTVTIQDNDGKVVITQFILPHSQSLMRGPVQKPWNQAKL